MERKGLSYHRPATNDSKIHPKLMEILPIHLPQNLFTETLRRGQGRLGPASALSLLKSPFSFIFFLDNQGADRNRTGLGQGQGWGVFHLIFPCSWILFSQLANGPFLICTVFICPLIFLNPAVDSDFHLFYFFCSNLLEFHAFLADL